jgi:hypothetical protein
MCCHRDRTIERRVRQEAKDGWVTGYKVVRVTKSNTFRPPKAHSAPDFKTGENVIPPVEMLRSRYNRSSPHGFHVYLDLADAFNIVKWVAWRFDPHRVIRVRGHLSSLIRAGTQLRRWKGDSPNKPQAVFSRIRIANFSSVRGTGVLKRMAAGS